MGFFVSPTFWSVLFGVLLVSQWAWRLEKSSLALRARRVRVYFAPLRWTAAVAPFELWEAAFTQKVRGGEILGPFNGQRHQRMGAAVAVTGMTDSVVPGLARRGPSPGRRGCGPSRKPRTADRSSPVSYQ